MKRRHIVLIIIAELIILGALLVLVFPWQERLLVTVRPTLRPEQVEELQMPPPLPSSFYGYVTYADGSPAPLGLAVCFVGDENGQVYCCADTFGYEGLTVYRLDVSGDQEDTLEREGAIQGEILAVRVGGFATPYRAVWHSGTSSELSLVYEGGPSTATPTATLTPTPSPTSTRRLPSPTPTQEPTSEPGGVKVYLPLIYRQRYSAASLEIPVERTEKMSWLLTPSVPPWIVIGLVALAFYGGFVAMAMFVHRRRKHNDGSTRNQT